MIISQEKITGYTGSAIFCGLLLLLLYYTFLMTKTETKEEGILVNFGTVDWAAGTFEPKPEGNTRQIPAENTETTPLPTVPQPEKNPPTITQNTEPTAALDDAERQKERQREQERLERERLEQQERQRQEAERRRIEAIDRQMEGAFGAGEAAGGNEGTASSGAGNQGSAQGNAPTGSYVGVGGYGGFDLAGRTLDAGGLPRPAYSVQEEGKIVINITVDPQGKVISAEIGRGTNITNPTMRNSALEAARKAKFNSIKGNNNQSGTITYNYRLN
jgi:TonB family protein